MSPKQTIKSMSALFIAMAFMFIGNALVVSSVGIILKQREVSEIVIGAISAFFFLGATFSTITSHRIIAKVGHIRAFGICSAMFSICIILHSLSENIYLWAILRFFLGFAYYGLLMIIESWLNQKAKNTIRSRVLSFYEVVFYLSFGGGILLLGFDLDAHTIFMVAACLIMFSSLPLNLLRIKEPLIPAKTPISIPKIFSIAPLAIAGSFIAGMVINGFFSMASLFGLNLGLKVSEVSFFMFSAMFGGFVWQILIGRISDKFGRKIAIMLSAFIAFIASLGFLFGDNIFWHCVFAFLLGVGIFCIYALSLARANDMLKDKSKSVETSRTVLFCYSLGSLISPLILGILMQIFGIVGFVGFYAVSLAFLFIFALNKPR